MNKTRPDFYQSCYDILQQVPAGKVTTYSEIARALKSRASRAVGTAMAKNKHLIVIPCHRVIRSDGSIGQYALGAEKKSELLLQEGVAVCGGKVNDLDKYMYRFPG